METGAVEAPKGMPATSLGPPEELIPSWAYFQETF